MSITSRSRFNSILVRLKVATTLEYEVDVVMFQFHTGSIKRSREQLRQTMAPTSFNSILVRLKADSVTPVTFSSKFQFHTGSIKSVI